MLGVRVAMYPTRRDGIELHAVSLSRKCVAFDAEITQSIVPAHCVGMKWLISDPGKWTLAAAVLFPLVRGLDEILLRRSTTATIASRNKIDTRASTPCTRDGHSSDFLACFFGRAQPVDIRQACSPSNDDGGRGGGR